MRIAFVPVAIAALALTGCMSSDLDRDGVTTFAGDAIAWNSSLQMVDPWEYGVQHTDLRVPAERAAVPVSSDGPANATTGGNP